MQRFSDTEGADVDTSSPYLAQGDVVGVPLVATSIKKEHVEYDGGKNVWRITCYYYVDKEQVERILTLSEDSPAGRQVAPIKKFPFTFTLERVGRTFRIVDAGV